MVLKPGVTNFQKAVANLWIDENNILNRRASRKHIGEIDPRYIYKSFFMAWITFVKNLKLNYTYLNNLL